MLAESYEKPVVTDYGSLARLTADFDVTFAGTVAKSVVLAAVSSPLSGLVPGPDMPSDVPPGDTLGDGGSSPPADGPGSESPGGDGPSGDTLGDGGSSPTGDGGSNPSGDGSDSAGDQVTTASEGRLPFTGYAAGAIAAAGAITTGTGIAIRAALSRRR